VVRGIGRIENPAQLAERLAGPSGRREERQALRTRSPGTWLRAYSRTPIVMGMPSFSSHLVGAHEIRLRLGDVSRQRVYQITNYSHFPRPIVELEQGKVWRAEDVDAWILAHRPQNQPPGT